MTKASFRFSPQILARLGEELNQTVDQSIAELVKNSYDADAKRCIIELVDVAKIGGSITVSDNGDGMSPDSIRDKWLVLGRSSKSTTDVTRLGRTPAGSKGLGRLAALRMGTGVLLESIERHNSRRIHQLKIDWNDFDSAHVVEDVTLEINSHKNTKGGHGTRTTLSGLRTAIGNDELRKLARSLLLLTDPFGDIFSGFSIELVAPEFKEIESLLKKKYFDEASFHLVASVDENGIATAQILDWQSQELAKADQKTLRKNKSSEPYKSPAAIFNLWVFLLGSGDAFSARSSTKGEINSWLRQFGGVYCYQDGIRVTPYGNSGNDWLEMNLSRARSPEERPSTNTSIGRIQLRGSGPRSLKQKTDRSGFIEDQYFRELQSFARDALDWMARWRLDEAEKRRAREKKEVNTAVRSEKIRIETAIAQAPIGVRKVIEDAFHGYERTRDREAAALRQEIQLYRTLSTAGITAATFSHESQGNPLKRIEIGVNVLKRRIPAFLNNENQPKLLLPVNDISSAAIALGVLGNATLSLIKATKRRIGKVSIHQILNDLVTLMDPFLAGMTTNITREFVNADPFLRTSQAALESVFANLINNSLAAFERSGTGDRHIILATEFRENSSIAVIISDSGPGIKDIAVKDIWLPGVTGRPDGTGLGLTIVKDTVRDLGGKIDVTPSGRLGGAEFTVILPIIGS